MRLRVPGCFYHVMSRGIEGRAIFADNDDRERFLVLLQEYLGKSGCACYAWTLMSNHYHFLIQTGDRPLAELMRPGGWPVQE